MFANLGEQQECSNGYVFTLPAESSTVPYSIYDAFFHDVQVEASPSTLVPSVGDGRKANEEWTNEITSTAITYNGSATTQSPTVTTD